MKRAILIAAAFATAVAAAIPVWLVLDDGAERNQAALAESTKPAALDCSQTRVRGCRELNQTLASLDAELINDQRAAQVEAFQTAIKESSFYKAALNDDLSQDLQLQLQQALQAQAQAMAMMSNVLKAQHEAQQAILNNLK